MKKFFKNKYKIILLSLFLLIFFVLNLISALNESLTFDEIVYLQEGRDQLLYHNYAVDPYNPPVMKELAVIPYSLSNQFYKDSMFVMKNSLFARVVILIFGLGILVLTYFFTKKLFGDREALFATFLLSLQPSLLAYSHYLTLDIGLTFFFLLSYIVVITKLNNAAKILTFGISVGLGSATKLSYILFLLLSLVVLEILNFEKNFLREFWFKKKILFSVFIIALITIWIGYFFTQSPIIKHREDKTRVSQKLLIYTEEHHLAILENVIKLGNTQQLPLGDFLAIIKNTALRSPANQCFFLGKFYNSCNWYFILVNFFLKTPIPFLIIFTSGIYFSLKRNKVRILLVPIVCIVAIVSVSKIQPFIRYVLPILPFMAIVGGNSIVLWQRSFIGKIFLVAMCLWYVITISLSFPHFITYGNEFAGNSKDRYQLLSDSNLDWGQSLPDVRKFIKDEKPRSVLLSYFGRDNGDWYELKSDKPYMSYKFSEICEFHLIGEKSNSKNNITLISSTNWYLCGYNKFEEYKKAKIKGILGNTILIF